MLAPDTGRMEFLVAALALVVFNILGRYGADSRDGRDWQPLVLSGGHY